MTRELDRLKLYFYSAIDVKGKLALSLPYSRLNSHNAKDFFRNLQNGYPLPIREVQTDNGAEFEGEFDAYLRTQHILHRWSYPRCPRINGCIERYQRTLSEEFIEVHGDSIREPPLFLQSLARYLGFYNTQRILHALGNQTPLAYLLSQKQLSKMSVAYTTVDLSSWVIYNWVIPIYKRTFVIYSLDFRRCVMRKNKIILLSLVLLLMMACVFITGTGGGGAGPTAMAGSADFSAQATSPQSIMLTWKAVDGATGYTLESGWNGKDFYPLFELPPNQTQYEDFTAVPGSTVSYRLQAVTSSGSGDWLHADATIPAASPHPITVNPTYDDAHTVNATIGQAGGSVSLTDAGGVSYKLDIPQGALSEDIDIQLIPLTGMDGWPLDGERLAAVRIEPDGLRLAEVATLSITLRSDGKPDLATVGFAFQTTGTEFHLQPLPLSQPGNSSMHSTGGHLASPVLQAPRVITLPVIELHGNGVGQGSTDVITDMARNNPPTDAGAAADQQQAAADTYQDILAPLVGVPPPSREDNRAARRLESELVNIVEQIQAANDGDTLDAAMKQFQKWQEGTQALTPDQIRSLENIFWDEMTSKFLELLDKAAEDCQKSTGNPPPSGIGPLQRMLQNAMNPPSSASQWSVLQNKMTSAYGDDVLSQAWSDLKQGVCGSFEAWKPPGTSGIICSLGRPFKITMVFMVEKTEVEFFPETMTKGLLRARMVIKTEDGDATWNGFGTYTVEFYSPTDANIALEWTGVLSVPGDPIYPAAKMRTLHYDLQHVITPDCP